MSKKWFAVGGVTLALTFGLAAVSAGASPWEPVGSASIGAAQGAAVSPDAVATITFDEFTGSGNPQFATLGTKGFTFTSDHAHVVNEPGLCLFGGCISNGTPYIGEEAGGLGQPITMTRDGGGRFKLVSVSAGGQFVDAAAAAAGGFPNASVLFVDGTKASGAHVTATLPLSSSPVFSSLALPTTFRGLVSITFFGNNATNSGAFGLDNIKVFGACESPPCGGLPGR
jgi:hypothetical protein